MTRPGTWQNVHTPAGWHLRLVGGNGEPLSTSEVLEDPDTVLNNLHATLRAAVALLRSEGIHVTSPDTFEATDMDLRLAAHHALTDTHHDGCTHP